MAWSSSFDQHHVAAHVRAAFRRSTAAGRFTRPCNSVTPYVTRYATQGACSAGSETRQTVTLLETVTSLATLVLGGRRHDANDGDRTPECYVLPSRPSPEPPESGVRSRHRPRCRRTVVRARVRDARDVYGACRRSTPCLLRWMLEWLDPARWVGTSVQIPGRRRPRSPS